MQPYDARAFHVDKAPDDFSGMLEPVEKSTVQHRRAAWRLGDAMMTIIDADREAAAALRAQLADLTGFWHKPGDDSAICLALARHRLDVERRLAEKAAQDIGPDGPAGGEVESGRAPLSSAAQRATFVVKARAGAGDSWKRSFSARRLPPGTAKQG